MKRKRIPEARLGSLRTEQRNHASRNLDRESTLDLVRIINREDAKVAVAVRAALPQVARAVDITQPAKSATRVGAAVPSAG